MKFYSRDIFSLIKKEKSEIKEFEIFSSKYCYYTGIKSNMYNSNLLALENRLTVNPDNHTYECYIAYRKAIALSGFHDRHNHNITIEKAIYDIIMKSTEKYNKLEDKGRKKVIKFFYETKRYDTLKFVYQKCHHYENYYVLNMVEKFKNYALISYLFLIKPDKYLYYTMINMNKKFPEIVLNKQETIKIIDSEYDFYEGLLEQCEYESVLYFTRRYAKIMPKDSDILKLIDNSSFTLSQKRILYDTVSKHIKNVANYESGTNMVLYYLSKCYSNSNEINWEEICADRFYDGDSYNCRKLLDKLGAVMDIMCKNEEFKNKYIQELEKYEMNEYKEEEEDDKEDSEDNEEENDEEDDKEDNEEENGEEEEEDDKEDYEDNEDLQDEE